MKKHFCPYCMNPIQEGEPCAVCGLTAGAYSPAPHHLPPGTILVDRYLVGRVLGEGGFGITYIGCDLRLELKVAIKEYFPSDKVTRHAQASLQVSNYTGALAGNYEQGKEKYLQEARTMARMNKQAEIVSVRDFFQANNTAYIVMEYVEGTTFKELVAQKGGRIAAGEFLHMIEPLFGALCVMHETGLIHRDISPDNLMMENGCVRLLDFGCARESTSGTETMTIALKQGYAPIEQYQNKGQGPWTDVYGLCATMYYCLTGKVPQQSLDRLCEDELILPRKLGVDLTENQERALLYGMGIRPRRRYQSIAELYAALYTGVPAPKIETGKSLMFTPEIGQLSGIGAQQMPPDGNAQAAAGQGGETTAGQGVEMPAGQSGETTAGQGVEMPAGQSGETPAGQGGGLAAGQDGVEAVTEHTVYIGRGEDAQDTVRQKGQRGKMLRRLKIAAAAAGVVCLIAIPFLLREKLYPASNDADTMVQSPEETDRPERTDGSEPEQDLFAQAFTLTEQSETALREALEGDAKAVIWDGEGTLHLTGDAVVLTKPLYIGENSCFEIATELVVADGGVLKVAGEMNSRGICQIKGDGLLAVEAGGELRGEGSIFAEDKQSFTVAEGGTANIDGVDFAKSGFDRLHYVDFSEEDIFANAAHVSTGEELRDALNSRMISIVIDGDLTLEDTFRYMDCNVMVSEGVTVTAPDNDETSLCFDGWYFVNYGTIEGRFQVGDWNGDGRGSNVFNYGQINNNIFVQSDCNIVNRGEMTIGTGWIDSENACFYNLGTLVHDGSGGDDRLYLDFVYGTYVTNLGTIRIEGETSQDVYVSVRPGAALCNHGTIELGANSSLHNEAMISGYGRIIAEDQASGRETRIDNDGVIRLEYAPSAGKTGALDVPANARFNNEGLVIHSSHSGISVPGGIAAGSGAVIPFAWEDDREGIRSVSTADELKDALSDDGCGIVIVEGDISLAEELIVTKGLAVASGELHFTDGGLTLRGGQAYLYDGKLSMDGNALNVSDGAVADISEMHACGSLHASDEGWIVLRSDQEDTFLSGQTFTLESAGRILNTGYFGLEDLTVSIGDGSVCRVNSMAYDFENCSITIKEGGELLFADGKRGRIGENTAITNYGRLVIEGQKLIFCGEIENYHQAEWYARTTIEGGTLTNHDDFRVDLGGESFTGDGVIKNTGIIHSGSEGDPLKEFAGSYSGNKIVYE